MLSYGESVSDVEDSLAELLRHFGGGQREQMPTDLPPVAQRIWWYAVAILHEFGSPEFDEIAP